MLIGGLVKLVFKAIAVMQWHSDSFYSAVDGKNEFVYSPVRNGIASLKHFLEICYFYNSRLYKILALGKHMLSKSTPEQLLKSFLTIVNNTRLI